MKHVLSAGWWLAVLALGWLVWAYMQVANLLAELATLDSGPAASGLLLVGVLLVSVPGLLLLVSVVQLRQLARWRGVQRRIRRKGLLGLTAVFLALQLGYFAGGLTASLEPLYLISNATLTLEGVSRALANGELNTLNLLVPDYSVGYWLAHTANWVSLVLALLMPAWLVLAVLQRRSAD
jgi:hypothetical protein